jgi:predicted secreted acid phosphatase
MPSRLAVLAVSATALAGLLAGTAVAGGAPHSAKQIPNLTAVKNEIIAYQTSGNWDAEYAKIEQKAQDRIARHLGRVTKPAIVFDVDDSALSTYPYEVANDFGYNPAAFNRYLANKKFTGIAASVSLVKWAEAHSIHVFYVTGRRDTSITTTSFDTTPVTFTVTMRKATIDNLVEQGFPALDATDLYLRPTTDTDPSVVPYKAGARASIEKLGYDIVANLGDQQSDLDGGHADASYKLPNPQYTIN